MSGPKAFSHTVVASTRRSWAVWEKRAIVDEAQRATDSISAVARRSLARLVGQLARLRAIGLDPACTDGVHPERLRQLAREGRRFTAQHLRALSPLRRRATLVATVLDTIGGLTDDGVGLFDRAAARMFRRAETRAQDTNFVSFFWAQRGSLVARVLTEQSSGLPANRAGG